MAGERRGPGSGCGARRRRCGRSESAAGSAVSSTWKSRSRPFAAARADDRSSSVVEIRHHEGDGAEHAAVRLATRSASRSRSHRRRESARCRRGRRACSSIRPAQRSRISAKTGQEIVVLRRQRVEVGAEQRRAVGVGGAERRTPCGGRRRPPTSCASRSRPTASSAPHEGAVGIRLARPDVALVDVGVACRRRPARPCRRSRSSRGERRRRRGGDRCRSIVPSAIVDVGQRPGRRRSASTRGALDERRRARWRWRGRSVAASGTAAKPFATSVLPPHGALVPLPQQQIGDAGWWRRRSATPVQREEHQRGEEARDVQPVLRLDQAEGEAGVGAGVPAANSATTAAISARPPAIRRPARK